MPTLPETIEQEKTAYLQAKTKLCSALDLIPKDRQNWSPAPTARTPIQIIAHCALAVRFIHQQMDGTPFSYPTTEAADAAFREAEKRYDSRELALSLLEEVSANYLNWLDDLTPERLDENATLPFGLGSMPVAVWLHIPGEHTRSHVPQLEYLQTIHGDRDWHL